MTEEIAPRREGAGAAAAPHPLPPSVLLGAAAALIALTAITVAASHIRLGPFNVVLALAIAGLKASLVALFFMHLKYGKRFLALVFLSAVFFAVLLVGFVVFDTTQYQPALRELADQLRAKGR